MLRAAFLTALLAGCYAPRVTPGVACTNACPGDQVCVEGFCRGPDDIGDDASIDSPPADAMIDGAPNVDTDGDGLFDNVDNCIAVANIDQHDEDNDDIGDVCDPCPHVAIGGVTDTDADGVGDACDPAPTSPKQHWLVFDPITSRRAEWSQSAQSTFVTDHMSLTDGYIDLTVAFSNARVTFGGSITVATAIPHQLAVSFRHLGDATYHYVEFYDESDGGGVKISKFDGTNYVSLAGTNYAGTIPSGAFTWTADVSMASQSIVFAAKHGATTFPMVTGAATTPPIVATTRMLFGTNNVTMSLDYIAVITTQ